MFQYIYDIYISGLIYAVPTALVLSIISIPELKQELAFKYLLGYTATGLCIGYTYPISTPLLAIYLLKDFEKEKEIRTIKKEKLQIEKKLQIEMEKQETLQMEMEKKDKLQKVEWERYERAKKDKRWF